MQHAKQAPFYAKLWRDHDVDSITEASFAELPIVTKAEISAAGRSAQVRDGEVCDEIFTSGTTSTPFVSAKSHSEQRFIADFYKRFYEGFDLSERPRALQFNNPYHGGSISVPSPVHMHRLGVYDRGSFAYARQLLTEPQDDHGVAADVTVLVGLERILRAFAIDTAAQIGSGLETKLTSIVTYAQYLSSHSRKLIEDAFGAPVRDRYGLSEIFGGASQAKCGWYFFDPSVWPEVVCPQSGRAIREGRGVLLLTSLYPFQKAQPFIRYNTGDIVEVTHSSATKPGELAIKPLGRERYAVRDGSASTWLIVPSDVYELIDEASWITRSPLFLDSAQVEDSEKIGHPRYHLRSSDVQGVKAVELWVDVKREELGRAMRISEQLREKLLQRCEPLRHAVEQNSASLTVRVVDGFPHDVISYRE